MAARTKSKVTPKYQTKYRVTNWAAYEESLRRRGDITFWFDQDAIDGDGFIVASELTGSSVDDASVGVTITERVKATIGRFTADGAYDKRAIYEALVTSNADTIRIAIPPQKTAVVDPCAAGLWRQRNDAITRIAEVGRRQWRKESGAHQQALAENGMYRYKHIIGEHLRAKGFEAHKRETIIAVTAINRMTQTGMPRSEAIAE